MSGNDWGHPSHVFRWVMVGVVILIAVWLLASIFFLFTRPMQATYYPMSYYHPFFFPFGFVFGLIAIFMIFGALRWLLVPWGHGNRRRYWRYRDESYQILRERYAKGEITKEQYDQMMQDLQKQPYP